MAVPMKGKRECEYPGQHAYVTCREVALPKCRERNFKCPAAFKQRSTRCMSFFRDCLSFFYLNGCIEKNEYLFRKSSLSDGNIF